MFQPKLCKLFEADIRMDGQTDDYEFNSPPSSLRESAAVVFYIRESSPRRAVWSSAILVSKELHSGATLQGRAVSAK